jgi:hypothetical protein
MNDVPHDVLYGGPWGYDACALDSKVTADAERLLLFVVCTTSIQASGL